MNPAQDAMEGLSATLYFKGLDPSTLRTIAGAAASQKFEPGQIVFVDGEPSIGLYIVQQGWFKGSKIASTGRELVIRFIGPGEAFNEIGVLAEGKNLVTVQALEPGKVWIIPREALLHLMEKDPQLCSRIAQNLATHVYHLMGLIENLSLCTVEGRLARLLLEQSSESVVTRLRWATQVEIAAQLGTVPAVINRVLHVMADEGLIRIERHQIFILNRQGLEEKAMLGD